MIKRTDVVICRSVVGARAIPEWILLVATSVDVADFGSTDGEHLDVKMCWRVMSAVQNGSIRELIRTNYASVEDYCCCIL